MVASANEIVASMRREAAPHGQIHLFQRIVEDIECDGFLARLLLPFFSVGKSVAPIQPLLVAVNLLALEGKAPAVAVFLPDAGGRLPLDDRELDSRAEAYIATARRHEEQITALVRRGVQTNPVARGSLLYPVELLASAATGLPVQVLSLGAAAGADVRAHGYRHRFGAVEYGDSLAKTVVTNRWTCDPAELPYAHAFLERASQRLRVIGLSGCDLAPIDLATPEGRNLWLAYSAHEDEVGRLRQRTALDDATRIPVRLDKENAVTWLPRQLSRNRRGVATIVWSSWAEDYMSDQERAAIRTSIVAAGDAATAEQPLYYARYTTNSLLSTHGRHRLRVWTWTGDGLHRMRLSSEKGDLKIPLDHLLRKAGELRPRVTRRPPRSSINRG